MKNKSILLILIIALNLSAFAQPGKIKKGGKLYDAYSFTESIEKYEAITDKTTEIKRSLAESYFNIHEYEKSENYYSDLMLADDKTSEDMYNYASVLAINKKYKESEDWMALFHKAEKDDSRGKKQVENKGFYKELQKDKGTFVIQNVDINSSQEDFGVAYFKDKIVFVSTKGSIKPVKRKWNWNELPFLDIYVGEVDSSNQIISSEKFSKVNKKYHEGPACFNKAGDYMIFTRNNYKSKSSEGIIKLEMYYTQLVEDKWQKALPMPFNSNEYSVGHASLTAGGDTMYFASDMPGGKGGVDLYISIRNGETWGTPKNLGTDINTEGNEMFPFIHKDGFLFYSSNGNLGLGGLDIYVARVKANNTFSKIENIGTPVNTSYDDFAFVLNENQSSGYFSSNRVEGKGDDDIYKFDLSKPFSSGKIIIGTAKDTDGNILANTEVQLFDNNGIVTGKITTTETGAYRFVAEEDIKYKLTGDKTDYTSGKNFADTHTDEEIIVADLVLARIPEMGLYCLVTDEETGEPLDKVKIKLTNNILNNTEEIVTDAKGDFRRELDNKLNDNISYNLVIECEGYMNKTITYNQKLDREGEYKILEALVPIKVGGNLEDLVQVNPIYFDVSKSNIRSDAALELDKIVTVMNEYPTMEVELGSHTDCRGSDKSNESLSDRRAKSSAQYIKERITNPDRINGKGYGESKLKIHCACENGKAHNLTKAQHQQNRRTEFKILKM